MKATHQRQAFPNSQRVDTLPDRGFGVVTSNPSVSKTPVPGELFVVVGENVWFLGSDVVVAKRAAGLVEGRLFSDGDVAVVEG